MLYHFSYVDSTAEPIKIFLFQTRRGPKVRTISAMFWQNHLDSIIIIYIYMYATCAYMCWVFINILYIIYYILYIIIYIIFFVYYIIYDIYLYIVAIENCVFIWWRYIDINFLSVF